MKRETTIIIIASIALLIFGTIFAKDYRVQRMHNALLNISNTVEKKTFIEPFEICKPKDKINEFNIPDITNKSFSLLVDLLVCSESLDEDEKKYWLNNLPELNTNQIDKLLRILLKEREKMDELPLKYRNQIKEINKKYSIGQ